MSVRLKPLSEQTIVVTGASSGIGLVTARKAAARGARVVLVARSGDALDQLADEIARGGGQAVAVAADVSDRGDVRRVVDRAVEAFGGFDTWVNNAGVFLYGTLEQTPTEDMRTLFDTNLWGLVYGSLAAVAHFKDRDGAAGGALVNVGSVLSDRAIPLQGIYCASKHAVKGFTDALRMELETDGAPVSVSLVKPNAIDTPYPRHAKNYMDREATVPPPVYAPDVVARAILHCAETPTRDVIVGGGGKQVSALGYYAPAFTDVLMEKVFTPMMKKDAPPRPLAENSLDGPAGALEERGPYDGHVMESSVYTAAVLHPWRALGVAAAAGAALALVSRTRS